MLFDTLGIALFTIVGLRKALNSGIDLVIATCNGNVHRSFSIDYSRYDVELSSYYFQERNLRICMSLCVQLFI